MSTDVVHRQPAKHSAGRVIIVVMLMALISGLLPNEYAYASAQRCALTGDPDGRFCFLVEGSGEVVHSFGIMRGTYYTKPWPRNICNWRAEVWYQKPWHSQPIRWKYMGSNPGCDAGKVERWKVSGSGTSYPNPWVMPNGTEMCGVFWKDGKSGRYDYEVKTCITITS